jgi:3D-(3,5/4)-trihydroxycyclohexane-1,2-dione acylhydrolase (decyclizing)
LDGDFLAVDYAAVARGFGAHTIKASTLDELKAALAAAKTTDRITVVVVETQPGVGVPGYDSWWDVAVAEVSGIEEVRQARAAYVEAQKKERYHLGVQEEE